MLQELDYLAAEKTGMKSLLLVRDKAKEVFSLNHDALVSIVNLVLCRLKTFPKDLS